MVHLRSDEALVARAQRGDRDAFDELVRRHRDRVYAVVLRLTRNPSDAEDALQDAFLNAYRALHRFDRRARFSTWLHRIATNAAFDVISRRRTSRTLDGDGVPEQASPGDPFVQAGQRRALEAALAALPDDYRAAVLLCDVAGLGTGEAAVALDLPEGTVKSRVFRARALIAQALREPSNVDAVQ